jgi:hypothetical protein
METGEGGGWKYYPILAFCAHRASGAAVNAIIAAHQLISVAIGHWKITR